MAEQEKTVAEIEAELSAVRENLAKRQAELAEAESKAAQIQTLYDVKSVAWLNYHDLDAKKWLDSSDRELFSAQSLVRQVTAASRELTERIERLEREQSDAKTREVEQQLAEEELSVITAALMVDDGIARLSIAVTEILSRQKKMVALAQSVGKPLKKYDRIPDSIRRASVWQLFPRTGTWFSRDARAFYEQPVSKILENLLRGEEQHWQDVADELTDADKKAS